MTKIGILGFGNMGQTIAQILLKNNDYEVFYCDRDNKEIDNTSYCSNLSNLFEKSEIIILSVKPQIFNDIESDLEKYSNKNHIIISIMAGVKIDTIKNSVNTNNIIRSMPNLALRYKESLTGWKSYSECSEEAREKAQKIFSLWGKDIECRSEDQLNTITATAGSGPAYYFMISNIIYKFLIENKFENKEAQLITKQVLKGASQFDSNQDLLPQDVIDKITSKGGTTEAAFKHFKDKDVSQNILEGINKAKEKAIDLEN
ncbi:MAG: NAD(P)-binding domain-containing protein [Parcubacteria group bacterium]|nr:NAD(P)-binding domain-containing protein [Parcubacteria group bacterium]